jgi:hypothetical protein
MRAIDQGLVDEVWQEMIAYAPDRVEREAKAFLERQPHVARFSHAVTGEFDEAAQKAALGLCFLLFKVLEASLGRPFPPLAEARVIAAYEATTDWLERWEGADPRILLKSLEGGAHPSLVTYILEAFYQGDLASPEYDAEVKASLFLLLRTLADALDFDEVEH